MTDPRELAAEVERMRRAATLSHYPATPAEWMRRMDVLMLMSDDGFKQLAGDVLLAALVRSGIEATMASLGEAIGEALDHSTPPEVVSMVRDRWAVLSERKPT